MCCRKSNIDYIYIENININIIKREKERHRKKVIKQMREERESCGKQRATR